jgi:hypothetical protein
MTCAVLAGAVYGVASAASAPSEALSAHGAVNSQAERAVPWHDLEEFLAGLSKVILRSGGTVVVHETVETLAVTLRDRPSQAAVHDALLQLWSKKNGGKWVTKTVCGSMGYIADQPQQLTWTGDDWKKLVTDNLWTIARHSGLPAATLLNAYSNAKDKLDRLNTTWSLYQVNPPLARWYRDACRG